MEKERTAAMGEIVSKLADNGGIATQPLLESWFAGHDWLYVSFDVATIAAFATIAGILAFLRIRRNNLLRAYTSGLCCAAALAVAAGHILGAMHSARPAYSLTNVVSAAIALISCVTAVALILVLTRWSGRRLAARQHVAEHEHDESVQSSQLASIVESCEDPIIGMTLHGVITTCNRSAARAFQYSATEVIGKSVAMLVGSDRMEDARRWLKEVQLERRIEPFEAVLYRRSGEASHALLTISPLRDGTGNTVGASMIARDLAPRNQTEGILKKSEERLREAQKLEAVGALAGGVAHEFNNLLQAIHGYTKYAMEGLPTDEQRYRDLERVLEASGRAALLTRQLLSFGGRQKMERTELDVNRLVSDMETVLRPLIGAQIDLCIELCPGRLLVEGDAGLLQETLLHLCINARDAMAEGGRLRVRTETTALSDAYCQAHVGVRPGDYVVLTIADTGQGIPKEVSGHIFEPFFTTKGVGKGTGLGLAMVYGVVQQHGGVIHVYSEPGQGATFKLYLPAVGVQRQACEAKRALLHEGTELILVAEDETMVRDLVVRILRGAGYAVLEASNGAEALKVFERSAEAIRLALLDVVMPQVSGRAVYERIKRMRPQMKVVFCTGYDPETGQAAFASEEGLRLIQKPVDPDVLLSTIREVLDDKEPCQMMQTTS